MAPLPDRGQGADGTPPGRKDNSAGAAGNSRPFTFLMTAAMIVPEAIAVSGGAFRCMYVHQDRLAPGGFRERPQVDPEPETAAEMFDRLFLPTLAGPWAKRVAAAAALSPGERALDVACGTGAVAGEAPGRVGPEGTVAGIDLGPDMLAVARRKLPDLDLREGRAEALPFVDEMFDVALCQFG